MDLPPIQYARAPDGVSIAYAVVGEGPPLVTVPGWASHLELSLGSPLRLPGFQNIFFDKRGTGLSDRDCKDYSVEARAGDLEAVVNSIGLDRFDLRGISEGGPIAIQYAAHHPDRVAHLVLYGTFARGDLVPREVFEALLPLIECPTLIAHSHGDRVVPFEHARVLARDIRQSRLMPIDSDRHLPGAAEGPLVRRAYLEFLTGASTNPAELQHRLNVPTTSARRDPASGPSRESDRLTPRTTPPKGSRMLTTILFTDIVGSTEQAVALGDELWTRLLDQHHRIARGTVERLGGRWIKSTGDGILATFDRPAQAVEAARAMRADLQRFGIVIRAGIHTGEVEQQKDDIGGIGVHIAGRVSAAAADGEIFVSPTVAALVLGSGLEFEERNEVDLKGVPGRWRLSALRTSP